MRRRAAVVVSIIVLLAVVSGGVAVVRYLRPLPQNVVSLNIPQKITLGSEPGPLPAPADGAYALSSDIDGLIATQSADSALPIASLTKTMTALVVLDKKPLQPGVDGPSYVITANDVTIYDEQLAEGGSVAPVTAGEVFTEKQLLLAMLLPSGNNIAETLALWISGTRDKFIAAMNGRAKSMGMSHTTFADPTGIDPHTVSSANDLILLGNAALNNAVLASVVATKSATLPDGTVVDNLDRNLSSPGWLGIKTGNTPEAGGCLLFAAHEKVAGHDVRIVGAVLGQADLDAALTVSLNLVTAVLAQYQSLAAPSALNASGFLKSPWGEETSLRINGASNAAEIVSRLPRKLELTVTLQQLYGGVTTGTTVAEIEGFVNGELLATWKVVAAGDIKEPAWEWRITH